MLIPNWQEKLDSKKQNSVFFAVESPIILREARWRIELLGLTNFQLYWLDWLEASRIEWSLL